MYNLRYHIASLVGVFLALALGLVLGGLVVRQGYFDEQQSAIVSSLKKEFAELQETNTALENDLKAQEQYSSAMTSQWISGRLQGTTLVILTSGNEEKGVEAAQEAMKDAGGSSIVVTLAKSEFGLNDVAISSAVQSVLTTSTSLSKDVPGALAAEWTSPFDPHLLTDALVKAGALKITGTTEGLTGLYILDLAAHDGKADASALDITSAYVGLGYSAVAAETTGTATGVAKAASGKGISAFDTLGTDIGRYTLVALLSGGQPGLYSSTLTGGRPFPPIPPM